MGYGIEIYDRNGNLTMDTSTRYGRIVAVVNPFDIGVPGSLSYPSLDPATLSYALAQGNSRVLTVTQSGTTISWAYADAYAWPEFSQPAQLLVLQI